MSKGARHQISEIRDALQNDKVLMKLLEDTGAGRSKKTEVYKKANMKMEEYKQELRDHRDSKLEVTRVSNKSAATRAGKLIRRFREEVRYSFFIAYVMD